jgi:hypothetical protein
MNADEYFDRLASPMQEIANELRRVVLAFTSVLKEDVKWNVPTYCAKKNVCSIMVHKNHVNFQLFQGAHIKDAQNLEGSGKDMRHLKFTAMDEVAKVDVEKFLKQALELDR